MEDRDLGPAQRRPGFSPDLEEKQNRLWRILTPVLLSLQLLLVSAGVELGLARQDSRWLPAVRAATLADYTGLWPDQPEREPLSPEIIGEIIADEMEADETKPTEATSSQEEREAAAESLLDVAPVPVTPTPTPSPTPTPGATASPGTSPSATATPSRTPTPTPSRTPPPSATVSLTPTSSPSPTSSLTPTPSPSPTPTATPSPSPTLPPAGHCISGGGFQISGKELRWHLANYCDTDIYITEIFIHWPETNEELEEVRLDGTPIWSLGGEDPPTIINSNWEGDRSFAPKETRTLKFRFDDKAAPGPYDVTVSFSNGDTVSLYVPGASSTPTSSPTSTPTNTPTPTVEPSPTPSPNATGVAQSEPSPPPVTPTPEATP